jgi:AcrR family transcriptional regulator
MPKTAPPAPRRRLGANEARELILDATEKRLVAAGPAGIRLQEVAADAGLSHPTVLHHFGSREQLVAAVIVRALHAINESLVAALQASGGDEKKLEAIIESVSTAFERTGHGRVILWLALEGHRIDGVQVRLADVVDAAHALRCARTTRKKKPPREDTAHHVVLAALSLVAAPVLGPVLLENAGLGRDARTLAEFRAWLARYLVSHFEQ